jgi:hypothetical protein
VDCEKIRNRQSPVKKILLFFVYTLFFNKNRYCCFVVNCTLPESKEYNVLSPGLLNAYCPPTPYIKPVAGFEPMMGTRIREPEPLLSAFGGLFKASLSSCGRSF